MTAILLALLLVGGSAAYLAWAISEVAQGLPVLWFVLGVPVAYFALPFIFTTFWFTLAWIWRTPRPPEVRLGPIGSARLFAGELLAIGASAPLMAMHRWLMREPAPAPAVLPIVLIHGVLCNDGVWFMLRRALTRRGLGPVYTINYGPPLDDIEHFVEALAAKVDAICKATGAARVALVGHSMGGLVARAYLRRHGVLRSACLITLGTPHHGSMHARIFPGKCLTQMRPGSGWLAEINRSENAAAPLSILSIWSRHDTMVTPQASAVLACARNIARVGIGHNALLHNASIHALIAGIVADFAPAPDPSA